MSIQVTITVPLSIKQFKILIVNYKKKKKSSSWNIGNWGMGRSEIAIAQGNVYLLSNL